MNFDVSVNVTQAPSIEILGYDDLKKQVEELVVEMKKVEVTEENIQGSKKLASEIRKKYNELDARRKEVKKELLKPYEELDEQMKELKKILDEGDTSVRDQIRALETKAREERKKELERVFNEYIEYYELPSTIKFDNVLAPNLLNKSVTLKRASEGLRSKLESLANDLNFIDSMIDDLDERVQVIANWLDNGFNAQLAVKAHKEHKDSVKEIYKQQLEKEETPVITIQPTNLTKVPKESSSTLVIYGLDNVHDVIDYCLKNKIQFKQI